MTATVFNEVRQIVADLFNVPVDHVNAESSPDTFENWDSLQHLNLILALEQSSGLQFTPEEIEQMLSVHSITMLIDEKLSRRKNGKE
jgi:acyl carrier protein